MSCGKCKHLNNIEDLSSPYVIRKCSDCGRKIKLREPGDNGHGIKVVKGDQFVFPKNFLQISANPLKSRGSFSKYGLEWFAEKLFVANLPKERENIEEAIRNNEKYCLGILKKSELLKDVNIEGPEQSEQVYKILEANQNTSEWWVYLFAMFNDIANNAIKENDAEKTAWSMACAERCRSMHVFKDNFEEVVWMGQSAKRIIDVMRIWDANKKNSNEAFWQQVFNENPYVLSQVFSVPVVLIKDKAYVGGMNIDRQDAKFVDYLYASVSSNVAMLVEIKTPVTRLLGPKYRKGVHRPSPDLSGSVVQVLDYRRDLSKNIHHITGDTSHKIDVFSPRCIVILGNAEKELDTKGKRKSFELFRTNLRDVEIVTYDELFKKADTLATLFNLTRKNKT